MEVRASDIYNCCKKAVYSVFLKDICEQKNTFLDFLFFLSQKTDRKFAFIRNN
jgi:hypothetical protein